MIIGIGVDTVDIGRFERQIERTPRLLERLFTESERSLRLHSLAARFAAKEALIKALGGDAGLSWQDLALVRGEDRVPAFLPTAALVRVLGERGASMPHVSMTHDGGMATAFVVLETGVVPAPGDSLEAESEQDGA
ncbi:holo-ACP synthase [Leucobacter sp. HNU]|uniref:holo-ACP synthase n=1 Tax=Leucobacter sp. HNU TaxID=3236805 RepID=UPI003A813A2E